MPPMHYVAMTPHTGVRLAEAGSGLIFAGIWLAAVQIPKPRFAAALTITAGIAIAVAGLLLGGGSPSPRAG
jgi:hypothetical protein